MITSPNGNVTVVHIYDMSVTRIRHLCGANWQSGHSADLNEIGELEQQYRDIVCETCMDLLPIYLLNKE